MTRQELQRLRDWSDARISAGHQPQWALYQLMKLREALDAIVAQMEAESIALEQVTVLPTAARAERGPRLVVSNTASAADEAGPGNTIKSARSG